MAKVHADAERREVEHAALAPHVGRVAFDMARAHPHGRLTLCPSAFLHGPSSRRNAASACRRLSALRSFSTKVPQDLNPSFVASRGRPRIMSRVRLRGVPRSCSGGGVAPGPSAEERAVTEADAAGIM